MLKHLTKRIYFVGLIAAYILAGIEYIVIGQYLDVYFSTVVIAYGLFILALHFRNLKKFNLFQWIGKNISGYMYIIHYPIIEIIENLNPHIGGVISIRY